jgi:hypothetical protein
MMRKLQRWLADQIVRPVPDRLAVCEFDCRATECRHPAWTRCEYRVRRDSGQLQAWLPRPAAARRSRPDGEGT